MSRQGSLVALIALVVLSMIWGYNWVVMKEILHYVGPFTFAAARTVLAVISLFLVLVALRRPLVPNDVPGLIVLGMLQTAGFMGLVPWALMSGGAGKTAVLAYTMPLWTLVLAWPILGERIHGVRWLAVIAALAGLVCILQPWRYHEDVLGALLAVLAGLSWAASAVWAKRMRARREHDLLSLTAWQMVFGAVPLVLAAVLVPQREVVWAPYFVGALIYNGVLATALAWVLWLFILHRVRAGVAGMGILLVPLIGVSAAWIQLGERPGGWERTGMILILAGLLILSLAGLRGSPPEEVPPPAD